VLLIYFGTVNLMNSLGEALNMPDLELSAFAAGVIALGLCFGAYATEVFRGAILAIPRATAKPAWRWACRKAHLRGSSCRRCGASPCPAWATCS
jgi:polar amino acid transport system permease protein